MCLHIASTGVLGIWNWNNWDDLHPDYYLQGIIEIEVQALL